ncbi:hypothetical protein AB0O68_02835 [Streptomyces sp. NPDC087512]|uniref:hypothetical protein n=1 Tax=Streptomyces sp. NPDC087512 TaxID=3155059 RepID=UPI003442635A
MVRSISEVSWVGEIPGSQQLLVRRVREGNMVGSCRAEQRGKNAGSRTERSFRERVGTQLAVEVKYGEDGPVSEEGPPECGGQAFLQPGTAAFGQRPREVGTKDLCEGLAWRKPQLRSQTSFEQAQKPGGARFRHALVDGIEHAQSRT